MRPRCRSTRAFFQRFHRGALRMKSGGEERLAVSWEQGDPFRTRRKRPAERGACWERARPDVGRRVAPRGCGATQEARNVRLRHKKSCRPATAAFPLIREVVMWKKVVQLLGVVMMIASGNASAQTGDIPFHELSVGNVNVRVVSLVQKDLNASILLPARRSRRRPWPTPTLTARFTTCSMCCFCARPAWRRWWTRASTGRTPRWTRRCAGPDLRETT